MKGKTTTSPSGRHIGHHHSLIVPDGVHYEYEKNNFSNNMWNIHHQITPIALKNETSLNQRVSSIVILRSKDHGKPKQHRLRLIHTYELEYNLIL